MRKPIVVSCGLVFGLLAGATASAGQEVSREEALARELLEVSGAGEMGLQVVRQMVESFAGSNPDVPREFWDRFIERVDPEELEEMVVPIYTKHLTAEEMEATIEFYRTPVGQSILRKMPVVMAESMQAGQQWGMELARKAMEELEAREAPPPEP